MLFDFREYLDEVRRRRQRVRNAMQTIIQGLRSSSELRDEGWSVRQIGPNRFEVIGSDGSKLGVAVFDKAGETVFRFRRPSERKATEEVRGFDAAGKWFASYFKNATAIQKP